MQKEEDIFTPEFLYRSIGEVLIEVQKVEWSVHGMVSIFNQVLVNQSNKRFKELNLKVFLSSDEEDSKYRKQTLGQLKDYLKENKNINYLTDDIINELETYVNDRNLLVHNFYRNYLHHKNVADLKVDEYESMYDFLSKVWSDSRRWVKFFMGLLAFIVEINKQFPEEWREEFLRKYSMEHEEYKRVMGLL